MNVVIETQLVRVVFHDTGFVCHTTLRDTVPATHEDLISPVVALSLNEWMGRAHAETATAFSH